MNPHSGYTPTVTGNTDFVSDLWGISPMLGILAMVIFGLSWLYLEERKLNRAHVEHERKTAEARQQEAAENVEVLRNLKHAMEVLTLQQTGTAETLNNTMNTNTATIMGQLQHMIDLNAAKAGGGKK